jgi:hypothetical protein
MPRPGGSGRGLRGACAAAGGRLVSRLPVPIRGGDGTADRRGCRPWVNVPWGRGRSSAGPLQRDLPAPRRRHLPATWCRQRAVRCPRLSPKSGAVSLGGTAPGHCPPSAPAVLPPMGTPDPPPTPPAAPQTPPRPTPGSGRRPIGGGVRRPYCGHSCPHTHALSLTPLQHHANGHLDGLRRCPPPLAGARSGVRALDKWPGVSYGGRGK